MSFVEKEFGLNDYFVIILVLILWGINYFLPKFLSTQEMWLVSLYSVTVASFFDNSFGALAFDFYDIMDGPAFTIMDLVVYLLYPPFGLLFLYFFKKFKIDFLWYMPFILCFSLLSIGFEWLAHEMDVFQYKNGYGIKYSICIYLIVQSTFLFFYKIIQEPQKKQTN